MRQTVLVLAVLATIALAGCFGGGGGGPEMSEEAQQLQSASVEAMTEVDAYEQELSMEVSLLGQSIQVDADAVVNQEKRRMRMDQHWSGALNRDTTVYIVNDTGYVGIGATWQQRDLSNRPLWDQNDQLEAQKEIFEASTIEITGEDTVDGETVTVVSVDVPDDKLDELTSLAREQSGTGSSAEITEATYTAYVDEETDRLRRMSADMEMEIMGETADATVTMTFSNFGTETDIQVPAEATSGSTNRAAIAGEPA